jgi:sulfite reductase (NADPH) flavoprotein alpha-component
MSVHQLCTEYLDLFGSPSRSFYLAAAKYSQDFVEKEYLAELSLPRKTAEFEKRENMACTYASTILEFKSLKLKPADLLELVPTTKPRLYSIASSPNAHPGEVHLLIVTHTFGEKDENVGLSTGYLEKLFPKANGSPTVVASLVRSPVLKLPQDPSKPIIMAGMGTGMAPFRAFVEERAVQFAQGKKVGSMRLYFGARHKHGEFYYQDQLEEYSSQGWLTLRCAWSRDQKQKIYVQMLMEQDGDALWEALKPEAGGSFYICGPIAPLPDIKKAILKVFNKHGLDESYLDHMEATGRFATEVY